MQSMDFTKGTCYAIKMMYEALDKAFEKKGKKYYWEQLNVSWFTKDQIIEHDSEFCTDNDFCQIQVTKNFRLVYRFSGYYRFTNSESRRMDIYCAINISPLGGVYLPDIVYIICDRPNASAYYEYKTTTRWPHRTIVLSSKSKLKTTSFHISRMRRIAGD